MMNRYAWTLAGLFLLLLPAAAQAQQTITGTVRSSEDDATLPGASVTLQGTQRGAATDAEGAYALDVPSLEGTLVVSYVGFVSEEVAIDGRTEIDVALAPDNQALDEVVVVGYGSQIQKDVTGNISRVSAADIENVPVTSVEETLQGRAAGVVVQQNNGKLGQGISVQVRGISSLSADTEPLYVVDGIPITTTNLSSNGAATDPLADLNFNDIASIEILKDAAASAIYGARASNGVVLITTKSGGRGGETQFNVNYQFSAASPTRTADFLNAEEYVELFTEAARNAERIDPGGGYMAFLESRFDRYAFGTDWRNAAIDSDWQEEAFNEGATGMNLDVSASGGDEDTQFYLSGAYLDEEGILIGNEFRRITGRVNVDQQINDWLQVGGKLSLGQTFNQRLSTDNSFATPIQLVAQAPISPVQAPDLSLTNRPDCEPGIDEDCFLTEYVPTGDLNRRTLYFNGLLYEDNVRYDTKVFRSIGNAFASVQVLPSLQLRSEFGVDLLDQNEDQYFNSQVAENTGAAGGLGFNSFDRILNINTNNFATYTQAVGRHDVEATAGFSFQSSQTNSNSVEGRDFPNDAFGQIDSAAEITDGSSSETSFSFLSYFGRANYKFADRYLFTLSGRVDGSSRFGVDSRYGFFPAVSAGWILTEEPFLSSSRAVSFLKLRGSVGETGNAGIPNFSSRSLFDAARYTNVAGIAPDQLGNEDLKWERTTQYDLGLEFGFFDNRINGRADVYLKNTRDLLLAVNVPSTTGFDDVFRNVGELRNRGVELQLNTTNILRDDFSWSSTFNFGLNRNEVIDLDGQVIEAGAVNRAIEGEPLGVFFALDYAGVDPDNGDALYFVNEMDADGTIVDPEATTNDPNEANRVVIGNPNPDFTGGFANEFSYRDFDLRVFLQFVYGSEIFDSGGRFRSASADFFDNQTRDQLDRWQEPGDQTDVPEARLLFGNGTADSDRYLYDGSYLRLKNVTLSYNVPAALTGPINLSRARLYLTGVNLLTFTDYKLWDPEVNADYLADESSLALGTDFYSAPQARKITAGLQFTF